MDVQKVNYISHQVVLIDFFPLVERNLLVTLNERIAIKALWGIALPCLLCTHAERTMTIKKGNMIQSQKLFFLFLIIMQHHTFVYCGELQVTPCVFLDRERNKKSKKN